MQDKGMREREERERKRERESQSEKGGGGEDLDNDNISHIQNLLMPTSLKQNKKQPCLRSAQVNMWI